MRIFFKFDWKNTIKEKTKIYFLNIKNKVLINFIFDEFQKVEKLSWAINVTFFNFSCFVIWRDFEKKDTVVVDIKKLNAITQSNAYSVSLQSNIIQAVNESKYILVIDCFEFFYQWRMHSSKKHKFIVVTHRDQKIFNVAILRFRNFSTYVQRQIDRILRLNQTFAQVYIDDMMILFKTLKNYLIHLRSVFNILKTNNISIKSFKSFIKYSFVTLFEQHVDSFDLTTDEQKFKTIVNLRFSKTLKQLKIYLNLTE